MPLAALAPYGRLCSGPCGGRAFALCAAHMPRPGLRAGPGVTGPGARRPRRLRGTRRALSPRRAACGPPPCARSGKRYRVRSSRALRGCPAPLCGPVCAGLRACAVGPARALARLRPCRPSGPGRRGPPPGPPCGPSPPLALRRGRAPPRGGGWGAALGPRLLSSRRAPRVRGPGFAAVALPPSPSVLRRWPCWRRVPRRCVRLPAQGAGAGRTRRAKRNLLPGPPLPLRSGLVPGRRDLFRCRGLSPSLPCFGGPPSGPAAPSPGT